MSGARAKLAGAWSETGSQLSIGLEPSVRYLPRGFEPTIEGHERFLTALIEATKDLACAFKANVGFFEALGSEGWALMERLRAAAPRNRLFIADGKFGDIGSTAEHYAEAIFQKLGADAATVNPLMGRDSVQPWLAHADRMTFFLVLTSNPGARDFLLEGEMYRRVGERLVEWGHEAKAPERVGFVVGATRAAQVGELREIAPSVPFLVPGIGAQGGSVAQTVAAGDRATAPGGFPGLLFHVTRAILPDADDEGDVFEIIRRKAAHWRDEIRRAHEESGDDGA